ncbi:S1 family peptidase [Metallumcola ferriviriculae]|uniref:S1 family peptidase n=1 Tax=Metallumcola ferriviriculae TaxID=3039180 RepID=A0AAU0UJV7_9FIRM|nr:S1 family peptidase [Desulfitibacteraceae bacterium MK1]
MKNARKALEKHRDYLMSLENVVGVGVGYKMVRGKETKEPAMVVFVSKKLPQAYLRGETLVPKKLDKMATDVIEVGEIKMYGRTDRMRPAQPGMSIGHYNITAGTFGAVVKDAKSGELLILSNCHVLANATNGKDGKAQPGDPIYQPGAYDGGTDNDIIAHLDRFIPIHRAFEEIDCPVALAAAAVGDRMVKLVRRNYRLRMEKNYGITNKVDCAVARPTSADMVNEDIYELGRVTGTTIAEPGLTVQKSGRTSGVTAGKVNAVDVTLRVALGSNDFAIFTDQVISDILSRPGDSGSLILDEQMQAVGLLFAGSDQVTVFNRQENVAEALEIKF